MSKIKEITGQESRRQSLKRRMSRLVLKTEKGKKIYRRVDPDEDEIRVVATAIGMSGAANKTEDEMLDFLIIQNTEARRAGDFDTMNKIRRIGLDQGPAEAEPVDPATELAKLTKPVLQQLATDKGFPEDEWKDLLKDDLVAYLVSKGVLSGEEE